MLSAGLTYDVLDWLSLSGRIRIDNSNNTYEQKILCKYHHYTYRR